MTDNGAPTRPDPRAGLQSMKMPELKTLATSLGVRSAGSLRKGPLVEAILATQGLGSGPSTASGRSGSQADGGRAQDTGTSTGDAPAADPAAGAGEPGGRAPRRTRRSAETPPADEADAAVGTSTGPAEDERRDHPAPESRKQREAGQGRSGGQDDGKQGGQKQDGQGNQANQGGQGNQGKNEGNQGKQGGQKNQGKNDDKQGGQKNQGGQGNQGNQGKNDDKQGGQKNQGGDKQNNQNNQNNQANQDDDDDENGSRRNRRRRGRERNERTRGRGEPDLAVYEDDVLVPAAGILDVLDNYAFVRTSGYLAGVDDVYVSLSMVRKYGLRRGDAVVGQVRQPREGERKEKFNPLVKIEAVNGAEPDPSTVRSTYEDLTPVFADERLRLETDPEEMTGRVLDLAAPLGKGQRVLVLSPASGGRSTLLRRVAAAVSANHPECHLMVVLVDERPEEVTELQRAVRGEVIASTCDRPATDHTTLAELAVERAKRLVELGHDVVVLFDGLSRLARAYNLAAPAGGRVLPGGLDTTAVLPVKQLFGSARNIEDGGSLTMVATAAVDNDSEADQLVLEEVRGAATAQVRLRRDLLEAGVVPAVDLSGSWTLREELITGAEQLERVTALREEVLAARSADGSGSAAAATSALLGRLRSRRTNAEVLRAVERG